MTTEKAKSIISELQSLNVIIHRLHTRLPNLEVEPMRQLIVDARTRVEHIDRQISHTMALLSNTMNYVRLDEVLDSDISLRLIDIGTLLRSLKRTGLVAVNNDMEIIEAFTKRHWEVIQNRTDNTEDVLYSEDEFHVFTIVFALAYKKSKTFNAIKSLNNPN